MYTRIHRQKHVQTYKYTEVCAHSWLKDYQLVLKLSSISLWICVCLCCLFISLLYVYISECFSTCTCECVCVYVCARVRAHACVTRGNYSKSERVMKNVADFKRLVRFVWLSYLGTIYDSVCFDLYLIIFSHDAIFGRRLIVHISSAAHSQLLVCTAKRIGAKKSRKTCSTHAHTHTHTHAYTTHTHTHF